MSDANRFCGACGASLPTGDSFCPKCGAAVSGAARSNVLPTNSSPQQLDWREQRRQMRAQRRAERPGPHVGGLIIATILIVAGLAIFFPALPWQVFWGALLIMLGVWIAYLWSARSRTNTPQPTQAPR